MKTIRSIIVIMVLTLTLSCSTQDDMSNDLKAAEDSSLLEQISSNALLKSKRPQPTILVDCIKYSGIVVPATFKPESDPFDELYAIPGGTFKYGAPLISDSKPGDQDYNGGRWHKNVLKPHVDPMKYINACSQEDLDLEDFESTSDYFGCPLRPINKK